MVQQAHFAVRSSEPSDVSCRCAKLHKQPNGQARKATTARRQRQWQLRATTARFPEQHHGANERRQNGGYQGGTTWRRVSPSLRRQRVPKLSSTAASPFVASMAALL
jgi:hypothetical protein